MANNSKRRREQAQKSARPSIVTGRKGTISRSPESMELMLSGKGGPQRSKNTYQRKPKHGGWSD